MPKNSTGVSKKDTALRRHKVSTLYTQGKTQFEIADTLYVSQSTISRDITWLINEWKKDSSKQYDDYVAVELAKINNLEIVYWKAWEESKDDAETITIKAKNEQDKEIQKQKKGQTGNPSFLAGVQWCIERRIKLLGIEKQQTVDVNIKTYAIVSPDDWDTDA